MENRMKPVARFAGVAAALLFAAALAAFGAALDGYSHALHPVALLGASGFPHALAFNLLGFVLPGVLAAVVAMALRAALPADSGWPSRIGVQLIFISALAFIAMGLLPLDPTDLESQASSLHGTTWMLWCVAFVPGALLLAAGCWRTPAWALFASLTALAAVALPAVAFLLAGALPAAVAQRVAFGLWFGWLMLAGYTQAGSARAV